MTSKNQHVVPHQDGWAVKGEGNQRATSVHDTQQQAFDAARQIARNSSPNSSFIVPTVASGTRIATGMIHSRQRAKYHDRHSDLPCSCALGRGVP